MKSVMCVPIAFTCLFVLGLWKFFIKIRQIKIITEKIIMSIKIQKCIKLIWKSKHFQRDNILDKILVIYLISFKIVLKPTKFLQYTVINLTFPT